MKVSSSLLLGTALTCAAVGQAVAKNMRELAAKAAKSSVKFAEEQRHLPVDLLMGLERHDAIDPNDVGYYDSEDAPYEEPGYEDSPYFVNRTCTVDESWGDSSQLDVDVVVAISECVDEATMSAIQAWLAGLQKPFGDSITFSTSMIPGDCEDQRIDIGGAQLMAQDRASVNAARLEPFEQFGQVVASLDGLKSLDMNPTAIISFVTDSTSYDEVQGFEASLHLQESAQFYVCKEGDCNDENLSDCIAISQDVDLFAYAPLSFKRHISCQGVLVDGLPIRYVKEDHTTGCFCSCPAGHIELEGVCTPVDPPATQCPWMNVDGYRREIRRAADTCTFSRIASNWKVPVPYPIDGYVADNRDNTDDLNPPRVDIVVTRKSDPIYERGDLAKIVGYGTWPKQISDIVGTYSSASVSPVETPEADVNGPYSFEWKDFQAHGVDALDSVPITGFGKYDIAVNAYDYTAEAQCPGCLAIVDKIRPQHTTECPVTYCDYPNNYGWCDHAPEFNEENLEKVQEVITNFYNYAELAKNDYCEDTERCDKQEYTLQNFFVKETRSTKRQSGSYSITYPEGKQCFQPETMVLDFSNSKQAKKNPLVSKDRKCVNNEVPVKPGQCQRCCSLATELREYWTDFKCGYDYDTRVCTGNADEKCSVQQCLDIEGDSLVTANPKVKDDIVAESINVLGDIDQKTYNAETQIHRSLKCSDLANDVPECRYEALLSDLIDPQPSFKWEVDGADVESVVFWRFRIDDGKWRLWHNEGVIEKLIKFSNHETMITLEAWTQCGKVGVYSFYVYLHLISPIDVCAEFNQMWYQSSVSLDKAPDTLCSYPKSDFIELTFDYHANIGLQYNRNEPHFAFSKVTCAATLDDRGSVEIIAHDNTDLIKRIGIELINQATTEPWSEFAVSCIFEYTNTAGTSDTTTCSRTWTLEDCDAPTITDTAVCNWEGCHGNDDDNDDDDTSLIGLYNACGGTIVRATAESSYLDTDEKTCCQGCGDGEVVVCIPLLGLPDGSEDLYRCEPTHATFTLAAADGSASPHTDAMVLVASAAFIAVVAIVVVKRRIVSHQTEISDNDAYFPLLH